MKTLAACALVLAGLTATPYAVAPETWTNVSLVDSACSRKVHDDPDAHTKDCAVMCAGSGFGILLADGTYLKFDKAGNDKTLAALKATEKKDHLRVTVTGERDTDTIAVKALELK